MKIDLDELATVTGGTLVVAAGKKAAKPNIQHHKTFGVKKPKGALPGASAGGWLKKGGKKVIIPDTRNAAVLEKFADKVAPFFTRVGNSEWTYTFRDATSTIMVDGTRAYFDAFSKVAKANVFRSVEVSKVTSAQVASFARYVQELGSIKLPKPPAFLTK